MSRPERTGSTWFRLGTERGELSLLLLTAVCVFGLHAAWLTTAGHPSGWDEITHLQQAVDVGEQVRTEGWAGVRRAWMGDYPTEERELYWPGLLLLATAGLDAVVGSPLLAARLMMLGLLILLIASVARGALQLSPSGGRRAALAATWCVLLAPLSFVAFRHFTISTAAVALAAAALVSLAQADGFSRWRWSVLALLALVVAAMADRLTGLFLLAPAWGLHLLVATRRGPRAIATGVLLSVAAVAATAPFYLQLLDLWAEALRANSADLVPGLPGRALYLAWWLPLVGLGLPGTLALAAALVRRRNFSAARVPALTWLATLPGAALVALFGELSQNERAIVFIPVVAVLGGAALATRRTAPALAAVVTALCLAQVSLQSIRPVAPPDHFLLERGLRDSPAGDLRTQDEDGLERLTGGSVVVLDLAQLREYWGAHWLYYKASIAGLTQAAEWPLRRQGTRYDREDPFLADPCGFETTLVLSKIRPWTSRHAVEFGARIVPLNDGEIDKYVAALEQLSSCTKQSAQWESEAGVVLTVLERRPQGD